MFLMLAAPGGCGDGECQGQGGGEGGVKGPVRVPLKYTESVENVCLELVWTHQEQEYSIHAYKRTTSASDFTLR